MQTIAIIGCTKSKRKTPCTAEKMYSPSTLFRLELEYVKKFINPDKLYILSAKYELIENTEQIEPYDEYLKNKTKTDKDTWNENVLTSIRKTFTRGDRLYFFCGREYYKDLIPILQKEGYECSIPLKEKGKMGEQMQWLKNELAK